jgi:N-methylhydantoinase A/oxoprolinase/acetone carboxylase beta subunit
VIAGYPIRLPALDVHTIGAGGGSIARIDPGGALLVGPESAGADPGPACYGRGGTRPTVTDADLVAGRIPAGHPLPGLGPLDVDAARTALDAAGVTADGVITVVDAAMEEAVRAVTVARGVDPRDLALVAFGGAGPLHACAVADALGMRAVVVPPRAGVCSAVGLLESPRSREIVASWTGPATGEALDSAFHPLTHEARRHVDDGATVETALDCRYMGQSHEITVPTIDAFPAAHAARNGYERPHTPIEVVAIRVRASSAAPLALTDLPEVARAPVDGPAVVAEPDCTVYVPDGWHGEPGPLGALILRRAS